MAGILRTAAAEADLAGIWSFIAAENKAAADKLLAQIDAAFNLIAKTPNIGFSVEGIAPGVLCKPVKRNYLIFYQASDEDVVVLRVLHGARKYDELL
jgi:toxin ParE1/3/4